MSKKIKYYTGDMSPVEHLRADIKFGNIHVYSIPNFPSGIIPSGYLDKCSSVAVAVTGSMNFDYLVVMPIRPDKQKSGSAKDIDIDPVAFLFKTDDFKPYPTGAALYHQDFPGRTSSLLGYEAYSLEQTVAELRSSLITGSQPISGSPQPYISAISHSIGQLDKWIGSSASTWLSASLSGSSNSRKS